MPFQIGHKIIGNAAVLRGYSGYAGTKATVVAISSNSPQSYIIVHIDDNLGRPEFTTNIVYWDLDPSYASTNYFDTKPCISCRSINHVGIAWCWHCNLARPHDAVG